MEIGTRKALLAPADLEIGDTAGLETCATVVDKQSPALINWCVQIGSLITNCVHSVHAPTKSYRGRIAPSPTGYLHLGHARTFWIAQQRANANGGVLVLRNEDLDRARCKPEFVSAMFEDLQWFGFKWEEGPDRGGPFAPYNQSDRFDLYRATLKQLQESSWIYPCTCSRKDIQAAAAAPHAADDNEPIYPGTCRSNHKSKIINQKYSWRFRVPDGETISFADGNFGQQQFVAGRDFGDFVVWRPDDIPSYQLACVADDAAMQITEVVRGADLLMSTARQLLLYRALKLSPPDFFHCQLLLDDTGQRLAKRHDSLSLRQLRLSGLSSESLRADPKFPADSGSKSPAEMPTIRDRKVK